MEHIIRAFEDDRPPERRSPTQPVKIPDRPLMYRCAREFCQLTPSDNPDDFCQPVPIGFAQKGDG